MKREKKQIESVLRLTESLCKIGRTEYEVPEVYRVEPFGQFFDSEGKVIRESLGEFDGPWTRKEIITRFLLLSVVLDQGPDISGVRDLIVRVVNHLYRKEVRIFHRPLDFFKELGVSIDKILGSHKSIKELRADKWAQENKTSPDKYNLIFTQSPRGIISTKQVLDYAVHRWGVPLCVPLLMEYDTCEICRDSGNILADFIESWPSAEIMSRQIKDHNRYGMGSAIGDKACHLFAKMFVSRFGLASRTDNGWTGISYELPFDSNAGRVLFRTGFLLAFASIDEMQQWNVVQRGKGKGGVHHIRVTNLRDKKIKGLESETLTDVYKTVVCDYLKVSRRPRTISIHHIPNILIYLLNKSEQTN